MCLKNFKYLIQCEFPSIRRIDIDVSMKLHTWINALQYIIVKSCVLVLYEVGSGNCIEIQPFGLSVCPMSKGLLMHQNIKAELKAIIHL